MSDASASHVPTIEVRSPRPDVALAVLAGEHDFYSADEVRQALYESLTTCEHLIVDLSAVEFIDSSIIAVLLQTSENAAALDRKFNLVVGTQPIVERILEVTGVVPLLNLVPTAEQALSE